MSLALTVTRWRDDKIDLVATKKSDGSIRDLTGCALFFGVKLTPDGASIIAAALGAGIAVTDAAAGKFRLILPALSKIGLSSLVTYYADVLIVLADGTLETPDDLSGTLTVAESIATGALVGATFAPTNFSFRPEFTGLAGGTATDLDGYDTTLLSLPFLFVLFIAGQRQEWQARAKTDADIPDDPQTVDAANLTKLLPANYDAATNNVIWVRTA